MASYELLHAVNTKGVRTTADVARTLGVDESQALRQLHDAVREALVAQDSEQNFWHLTQAGYEEWDRSHAERAQS
jgi:DNA-binding IclR family transcriptional regulator